ncbi:hypothetical protein GAYE_SCF51G6104 [Galdieria yellowstonensis]|uniref:Uncharacterized protein n=1 Tax=Galdieria yellowstonensis TaxID=3028027 RepID=A0AAV9IL92_9RHOD|nr:hypothetical protein GAYE_SCF51G6104 [Galdieria yellowstonensis]
MIKPERPRKPPQTISVPKRCLDLLTKQHKSCVQSNHKPASYESLVFCSGILFLSFFAWFLISPLVTTIKKYDHLTALQEDNTEILASAGTFLARLVIGPLLDRDVPRTMYRLTVFSFPVFLTAAIFNQASLATCLFFIGMIGAAFVVTKFWSNLHFAPNIIGLAAATTGGWSNVGDTEGRNREYSYLSKYNV